MKQERPPGRRPRRLQIRVSVDEHMEELFTRLQAIPSPLRGRELVTLARVACSLNAVSATFAALLPSGGLPSAPLAPGVAERQVVAAVPNTAWPTSPEILSEQAAKHAAATFEAGFLMAIPSLEQHDARPVGSTSGI